MNLKNELLIRLIADTSLSFGLIAAIVITDLPIFIKALLGLWLIIELIAVYRSVRKIMGK